MAVVIKFCKKMIHIVKQSKSNLEDQPLHHSSLIHLTDADIQNSENYFFKKCSAEVKHFLPVKKYEEITNEKDGILLYSGRILNTDDITIVGRYTNVMKDLGASTFCVPVVEKHSPVAYAIVNEIHWYHETAKHSGIETTLRFVSQVAHIIEARSIVKSVKRSCQRCRFLAKKSVEVAMGPVSRHNLVIAPAFYITQVDLCGPFLSYSPHHKRTTVKIWFIVSVCSTTSTTSIKIMDDYSTTSFIMAFTRLACDVGYPKLLLCDSGSQLIKGCQDMRLDFTDIKGKLFKDVSVEFEVCPVGGHNVHGKVERKIKEIKLSIERSVEKERLSIIQWETLASQISNSINNLPLAIGSVVSDLENLDILTPNRLKLGRNNERSPTQAVTLVNNPSRIIKENSKIFNSWFENWLMSHVPKLLKQQKWFSTNDQVKVGDIILFLKQDSSINSEYQYGMVKDVMYGSDGIIRKVVIKYKNHNENAFRETFRSLRTIVVINHVDETDLAKELGEIAVFADARMCTKMKTPKN